MKVSEMLAALGSEAYIERVSVGQPRYIPAAKKAIRKAIKNQLDGKGFSMVEVLSTCPTNWGMHPTEAGAWLTEKMIPCYPLGKLKDFSEEAK